MLKDNLEQRKEIMPKEAFEEEPGYVNYNYEYHEQLVIAI